MDDSRSRGGSGAGPVGDDRDDRLLILRRDMVMEQLVRRGIRDPRVLEAMSAVPRHRFVDRGLEMNAYDDRPLPIEAGQTISQPFIVALMTEALGLRGDEHVL